MGATVRLLLGGDAMLGRGVDAVLRERGAAYPFAPLAPLFAAADLRFVNLECAITPRQARFAGAPKAFYFRADPVAADALAAVGIDLVSLANNHALDAGPDGLRDTFANLAQRGIRWAGAGTDVASAIAPCIVECQGQRIGVLACCDHQPDFAATARQPGIHYLDLDRKRDRETLIARTAALARAVDHAVVSLHWMANWVPAIPPARRRLAHALVDAGARLVWGHSPHHVLGAEWCGASVVLYSTGNLLDDYALDPHYRNDRQLLYRVELAAQGATALQAWPIELDYARTRPADAEAQRWLARRLADACRALGSDVLGHDGAFAIVPAGATTQDA
ncbi:MAG TPA: CapA family protein [Mizugakiibacter sp.]